MRWQCIIHHLRNHANNCTLECTHAWCNEWWSGLAIDYYSVIKLLIIDCGADWLGVREKNNYTTTKRNITRVNLQLWSVFGVLILFIVAFSKRYYHADVEEDEYKQQVYYFIHWRWRKISTTMQVHRVSVHQCVRVCSNFLIFIDFVDFLMHFNAKVVWLNTSITVLVNKKKFLQKRCSILISYCKI